MANIMNHIAYLSQEIGARPANTEEEQRASSYIADTLKKDARLDAEIEEFYCNSYPDLTRAIYCSLTVLILLLAHFVSALTIPALIISLLMAGCMIAETLGHPLLSRVFNHGISQNVVAKYVPPAARTGVARRRKIILVANYDSAKVRRDTAGPLPQFLGIVQKVVAGAMVAVPVLLLFKLILVHGAGPIATLFTVLLTIAGLLCLLPLVLYIVNYLAPFSDAANNNASGVAALLDIARLVGNGKLSAPVDPTGVNHGEYAAAGVIPEGATLSYEAARDSLSPEEQLIAAKAAIASMMGQPLTEEEEEVTRALKEAETAAAAAAVAAAQAAAEAAAQAAAAPAPEMPVETPVVDMVQDASSVVLDENGMPVAQTDEVIEGAAADAEAEEPAPAPVVKSPADSIPDWYTQAKAAAKRNAPVDDQPIHRSRYAVDEGYGEEDFLETAQAIMSNHAEEIDLSEDEHFLNLQADIMNVQAPHSASDADNQSGIPEAVPFDPYEYMPAPAPAEAPEHPTAAPAESTESVQTVEAESVASIEETPVPEVDSVKASEEIAPEPELEPEPVTTPSARAHRDVYYLSPEQTGALIMDPTLPIDPLSEETKAAIEAQGEEFDYSTIATPVQDDDVVITTREVTTSPQSPASTTAMPVVTAGATTAMPAVTAGATTAMPAVGGNLDLDALRQEATKPAFDPMNSDATQEIPQRLIAEIAQPAAMAQERYAAATPDALSASMLPAIDANDFKQRAPLAAVAESDNQSAAQSLLAASLPTIEAAEMPVPAAPDVTNVPMHVTSAFEPISIPESIIQEEEANDDYDFFVDDVEDTGYAQEFNDASDFTSTGYVEMPQSRLSKFFGKFNRKKKRQEESASSWLGVDDDFDARTVGKDRGGWESFRDDDDDWQGGAFSNIRDRFARKEGFQLDGYEDYDAPYDDQYDQQDDQFEEGEDQYTDGYAAQYDNYAPEYEENAGATVAMPAIKFAPAQEMPVQETSVRAIPAQSDPIQVKPAQPEQEASVAAPAAPAAPVERESVEFGRQYRDQYADVYADQYGSQQNASDDAYADDAEDYGYNQSEEVAQDAAFPAAADEIFSFASGSLDTEVWFVALGSELAENGGMKAFMHRHANEMRGAVVINLESLGSGNLCYLEEEGYLKTVKLSSRMKRYLRQATQTSGVEIEPASVTWRDTAASLAAKQRLQAVTLVGMDGAKPAGLGEVHDTIEDIDPEVLRANEHFIIDMMKSI